MLRPTAQAGTYTPSRRNGAFTLIELLIVVAIIAILAAIAVPNFLEAQTRAKVSRVKADQRTLATAIESYRVDHNKYPLGTDNPNNMDPALVNFLQNTEQGDLAPGYYTQQVRAGNNLFAGTHFHTITTPIAYVSTFFTDPFADKASNLLTYCYRPAKGIGNGYILTSFGPDSDMLSIEGGGPGKGTLNDNPLSTLNDGKSPSRLGDINERAVIHYIEGDDPALINEVNQDYGGLRAAIVDLEYDPTNGTVSDGDLFRIGPQ